MTRFELDCRQRVCLAVTVAVCALLAVLVMQAKPATAAFATNVGYVQLGNDYFVNHDYYTQNNADNNVDWQMNYVFYNGASQQLVEESLLWPTFWQDATAQFGNKYAVIKNDAGGWVYEGGDGKATSRPFCGTDRKHYRPYAPNDYAFYDPTSGGWGYWVVASSHRDINDGCGGRSGWSEDAENQISDTLAALTCGPYKANCGFGARTYRDYLAVGYSHYGYDRDAGSNHYWQTDGYATVFRMN